MFKCTEYGDIYGNLTNLLYCMIGESDNERFASYIVCLGYFGSFHKSQKRDTSKEMGNLNIYIFFNFILEILNHTN